MGKISKYLLPLFLILALTGCTKTVKEKTAMYHKITPEQAKTIMDAESDIVILDVRTDEEFAGGHIKNAVLIPDYSIEKLAPKKLTDKKAKILVYCRSGRRSKTAAESLVKNGYENVYDFGGIIDWPYETEK